MFPINDTQPNRYGSMPLMTITLIGLNTAILVFEMSMPQDTLTAMLGIFGFTPASVWSHQGAEMIASITSMFLHGGIVHLVGNMLFLWVFGRRVEDACGSWRFLLFYLFAGVTADLITALVQPNEAIPGVGASGAIFGVMGAYLLLFPEGRIRTLLFITFVPTWPRIRAYWFVLYYLAVQIPPALDSSMNGVQYNVGYWAHIGGFSACVFILLFLRPEAFARYMSKVEV